MCHTVSFHEAEQLLDNTVTYVHICFSQSCHFRPTTQPNPLKPKILDPHPTNPTHGSTQPMDNSGSAYRWKETDRDIVMSKCMSVCLSVCGFICLAVGEDFLGSKHEAELHQLLHVAYGCNVNTAGAVCCVQWCR